MLFDRSFSSKKPNKFLEKLRIERMLRKLPKVVREFYNIKIKIDNDPRFQNELVDKRGRGRGIYYTVPLEVGMGEYEDSSGLDEICDGDIEVACLSTGTCMSLSLYYRPSIKKFFLDRYWGSSKTDGWKLVESPVKTLIECCDLFIKDFKENIDILGWESEQSERSRNGLAYAEFLKSEFKKIKTN